MQHIEVIHGSGNIWRDFGYADADIRQAKGKAARAIISALRRRKVSKARAAELCNWSKSDVAKVKNAELKGFTLDKLLRAACRLGYRIDVS